MLLANVGVPMVCVTVPTMLFALPLIALVEAAVLKWFCGVSFKKGWSGALPANLWSTLLGIPATWLALAIAQMFGGGGRAWGLDTPMDRLAAVTLQAPWLIPYEHDLSWMMPAASLVLLVPFYLASVVAEYLVLRSLWGEGQPRLLAGVIIANAASYVMLGVFWATQLALGWNRGI